MISLILKTTQEIKKKCHPIKCIKHGLLKQKANMPQNVIDQEKVLNQANRPVWFIKKVCHIYDKKLCQAFQNESM